MKRSEKAAEIVNRILCDSEHGEWAIGEIDADKDVNLMLLELACRALAIAERAELACTDPAKWTRRVVEDREKFNQ